MFFDLVILGLKKKVFLPVAVALQQFYRGPAITAVFYQLSKQPKNLKKPNSTVRHFLPGFVSGFACLIYYVTNLPGKLVKLHTRGKLLSSVLKSPTKRLVNFLQGSSSFSDRNSFIVPTLKHAVCFFKKILHSVAVALLQTLRTTLLVPSNLLHDVPLLLR